MPAFELYDLKLYLLISLPEFLFPFLWNPDLQCVPLTGGGGEVPLGVETSLQFKRLPAAAE